MGGRIKLACDQPRHEAAEGRADLVAACGEILAHHQQDLCLHAGQLGRQDDIVRLSEESARFLRFVLPGDAEEVQRIHFPQAHMLQLLADFLRDGLRILHLRNGRNDDILFLCPLDVIGSSLFVDRQVNHFPLLRMYRFFILCALACFTFLYSFPSLFSMVFFTARMMFS